MSRPRRSPRPRCVTLAFLLCWLSPLLAQNTIHVPADQVTVQAAIDAAANGDTVLIAPGQYNESIDFKGKSITVTGTSGQGGTSIAGPGGGPTVSFTSGEGPNSILTNLTIEGGGATGTAEQAGIFIKASSPTLRNNQIFGAACHGIHVVNGAPLIDSSRIAATGGNNANAGCTIANGTGIFVEGQANGTAAVIQNNTIEGNYTAVSVPNAESGGAGIFAHNGALVLIQKNIITGNGAADSNAKGGAILLEGASALIINNLIYNNVAGKAGGGIAVLNGAAPSGAISLVNNTVAANTVIQQPTFLGIPSAGEEVDIEGGNPVTLNNNIFWANDARAAVTCNGPGVFVTFSNDDIHNAVGPTTADVGTGVCGFQPGLNGNLSADPRFADVGFSQFHLTPQSPAIDAGSNADLSATSALGANISTDLDGNPRVVNGQNYPSQAVVDMGCYEFRGANAPTAFALTSSLNPSNLGQTVTFSAAVSLGTGTATGTVTFSDGATQLGTVALSAGTAQFATANLTAGTHTITALFNPGGTPGASTATLIQVVNGLPTSTSVTVSPAAGPAFSAISLSSTVTSTSGTPTGTVTFTAGGQVLATVALQPNGTAGTVIRTLGAGTYSITATYTGDTTFQASTSGPAALVLSPLPDSLTFTAAPNPASVGQSVAFHITVPSAQGSAVPTGSVTFSFGAATLGTVTLDATGAASLSTTLLPAGTDTITAAYSGDANYLSASAAIQELVTLIATSTTLTSTPNPSYLAQAVTLTSTSTAAGSPAKGTVTFYDGQTPLASLASNNGSATFTLSTLAVGQHTLTAVLGSGPVDAASTSPAVSQTVLAAGFAITLAPSQITLGSGKSGSTLVQLASLGNFAGTLQLFFGHLPPHSTGSLASPTLTLTAGGQGSTTFSLATVDLAAALHAPAPASTEAQAIAFALLTLPVCLRKRRRLSRGLLSLALAATLLNTLGCTDIRYPLATVAPGLYSIPITATDSQNVSQTAILQVNITP